MYQERGLPQDGGLYSILLVGARNLPALLEGTQSPFKTTVQFTIPYFEPAEVMALFQQHTAETGQAFHPTVLQNVINAVYRNVLTLTFTPALEEPSEAAQSSGG